MQPKKIVTTVLLLIGAIHILAQPYSGASRGHSHNDYLQAQPFTTAYENGLGSIEADIWAVKGELYVAHDKKNIVKENTLDRLYLQPIIALFKKNKGKVHPQAAPALQLMIDLKDTPQVLLRLLEKKLRLYPHVFNPAVNPYAVRILISAADTMTGYPIYMRFDGRIGKKYEARELKVIDQLSEDFARFFSWKGEAPATAAEFEQIKAMVQQVHALHKKIRFWNTPDHERVWKTLLDAGVDYVGTDTPQAFAAFYKKYIADRQQKK